MLDHVSNVLSENIQVTTGVHSMMNHKSTSRGYINEVHGKRI